MVSEHIFVMCVHGMEHVNIHSLGNNWDAPDHVIWAHKSPPAPACVKAYLPRMPD